MTIQARQLRLEVEEKLPDGGLALVETAVNQAGTVRSLQTAQYLATELQKLKGITNEMGVAQCLQVNATQVITYCSRSSLTSHNI
jgi:hypothetical protein